MSKTTITDVEGFCIMCGKPTRRNVYHHCIFGTSQRRKADEDGIYIPVCDECHNMNPRSDSRIHGNPMAEKLSKMMGQLAWEKQAIADGASFDEARELFRKRYGRSYL